jgi:hypothetical protein
MWIAKVNIGLRKILLLFIVGVLFCNLFRQFSIIFYCSIGFWVGYLITFTYITYKCGVFIRLYSWTDRWHSHEVRQYISFINPKENYRGVCPKENVTSNLWDSRIYTTERTEWAFFDIIRKILNANTQRLPQKILLLGGGGGAIPYTISKLYPTIQIDTVEFSKQMISVAKRFICRTNHQKIKWIRRDAFAYIKQCARSHKTYDCVIVDLFEKDAIPKFINHPSFVQSLFTILKKDGLLFMNLGWKTDNIQRLRSSYTTQFNNYKLYLNHNNIIGINWSVQPETHLFSLN